MPRASELAEWRDIPGESGQRMQFRPLTGSQIREARRVALEGMADQMKAISGVDLSGFRPEGGERAEVDEAEQRRAGHDPQTVVRHGLVAWTYDVPCDDEHKADLVAGTEEWAADCILEMSLRTEAAKKASTEPSSPGASPLSLVTPTN